MAPERFHRLIAAYMAISNNRKNVTLSVARYCAQRVAFLRLMEQGDCNKITPGPIQNKPIAELPNGNAIELELLCDPSERLDFCESIIYKGQPYRAGSPIIYDYTDSFKFGIMKG